MHTKQITLRVMFGYTERIEFYFLHADWTIGPSSTALFFWPTLPSSAGEKGALKHGVPSESTVGTT